MDYRLSNKVDVTTLQPLSPKIKHNSQSKIIASVVTPLLILLIRTNINAT